MHATSRLLKSKPALLWGPWSKSILAAISSLVLCLPSASAVLVTGQVVRVIDGDTVAVREDDSTIQNVRLANIDAPECGMPFGPQARQHLEDLVLGRTVLLVTNGRDRYRRTVASLSVDQQDIGLAMIRAGMAWYDGRFARRQGRDSRIDYSAAERSARAQGLGLWVQASAAAPWAWRANPLRDRLGGTCAGRAPLVDAKFAGKPLIPDGAGAGSSRPLRRQDNKLSNIEALGQGATRPGLDAALRVPLQGAVRLDGELEVSQP